jgi:iron(III) transport system permease protein
MAETNATVLRRPWPRPDVWGGGALVVAALVLAPVIAVAVLALQPAGDLWAHLWATVLPRYLGNTLVLMLGAGLFAAVTGTGCAWLVTQYRFPGARWLEVALLFPLAIPAYVGAYALVDFLDYSGPVQGALRAAFGWTSARDYAFPEVRSAPVAALVFGLALYPYVYLLTRAALREQSGCMQDVARTLGAGPWGRFWRVALPMVRPAVAAGVALVMMEVVADYGTVAHFGVPTLTTGIFSTWLEAGNPAGAAQIALLALGMVLAVVLAERGARGKARFHRLSRTARPVEPVRLRGGAAWAAAAACALPFALGFLLPVGVMAGHALRNPAVWAAPGLAAAAVNTLSVAAAGALVTVGLALFLVYAVRLSGRVLPQRLLPLTLLGYAAPGAVLALGVLVPMAALDHLAADAVLALTGHDPGLLVTGTAAAMVIAYAVRFFAVAQGALDAALGRVSPSLPMAARSLGRGPGGTLAAVYLPMLRGSVGTALLIVFVDCVKELPATLLLRPFGFETLATRMHELATLERLGEAAPAALLVTAAGLTAVALLARHGRGVAV